MTHHTRIGHLAHSEVTATWPIVQAIVARGATPVGAASGLTPAGAGAVAAVHGPSILPLGNATGFSAAAVDAMLLAANCGAYPELANVTLATLRFDAPLRWRDAAVLAGGADDDDLAGTDVGAAARAARNLSVASLNAVACARARAAGELGRGGGGWAAIGGRVDGRRGTAPGSYS